MPETPLDPNEVLGIDADRLPRHIAIIMDGNGRWAQERGMVRVQGHERGGEVVRAITTECAKLGIEVLTLYSFSCENWKRPKEEVDFLMQFFAQYLASERQLIMDNNIRLIHVGRREGLPQEVLDEMDRTLDASANNTGLKLCLAINYGSRDEILDAVRNIASDVVKGNLDINSIDSQCLSDRLYAPGLPDPDLLVRTSGEYRISNFLLWQISYAEIFVTDVHWPDFKVSHLHEAIKEYARRDRRFGGVAAAK